MLLLKKSTFEVTSDSSLVLAENAAAVASAEQIVAAAEEEAVRIREEAKAAYEEEKRRGYDDGIAAGKQEILMQKLDLIDASVSYMESVEQKMSDIVMKALKKCVAEIGDRELVVQIVKKSMQAIVRNQNQITVRVASEMVPVVKARIDEILSEFHSLTFIDVREDPHLSATACVVETEAGSVDASVEGQLEAIERSMKKNFEKR